MLNVAAPARTASAAQWHNCGCCSEAEERMLLEQNGATVATKWNVSNCGSGLADKKEKRKQFFLLLLPLETAAKLCSSKTKGVVLCHGQASCQSSDKCQLPSTTCTEPK